MDLSVRPNNSNSSLTPEDKMEMTEFSNGSSAVKTTNESIDKTTDIMGIDDCNKQIKIENGDCASEMVKT